MFRTHFRLVVRNLFRQKVYTLINLAGLSIGLAGAFILILYVLTELNYDRFNDRLEKIYRINTESTSHEFTYSKTPYVLGTTLLEDFPEEFVVARTFHLYLSHILKDEELFEEAGIFSADPELMRILTFDISGGNIEAFDGGPNAAMISESMAERYFGEEYPVGRTLTLENNGDEYELEIVAMFEDLPGNSSFRPNMLVSHDLSLQQMDKLITTSSDTPFGADFFATSWSMYLFFTTYILIPEGQTPESVKAILDGYEGNHYDKQLAIEFQLQEYGDIYFGSGHLAANIGGGDKKMVYIYSMVAFLLLLTATLNYILLSISVMGKRKRELGLKIIHGAAKGLMVRQILLETTLFTLLGMVIALTISELVLPLISQVLFGKLLTIDYVQNWIFTAFVLFLSLAIGLGSGAFLAFNVLSAKAAELMNSRDRQGRGRIRFTKIVSTVQLAISMTLLICTGTIFLQLNYFTSSDIGFNLEEVVSIDVSNEQVNQNYEILKERIANIPGVESVSGSMWAPPTISNMRITISLADHPDDEINVQGLMVDYNIARTLGLRMLEGRDFDPEMGSESGNLIINEEAVRALGIEGPATGTRTSFGTIVGVVEDFHIHSFHSVLPPLVIQFMPGGVKTLLVRIQPDNMETVLEEIKALWEEILADKAFHLTYLVDALADLYNQESRFASILTIFSGLNLFISLLGIFGMARLNTERRTREVGIRKVMGAESSHVLNRFVYEYILLTMLAALFAFPSGYLLMAKWLSNFEYHGQISIVVFIFALALSIVVVGATVAWHVWKAANSNPIDAIRYE